MIEPWPGRDMVCSWVKLAEGDTLGHQTGHQLGQQAVQPAGYLHHRERLLWPPLQPGRSSEVTLAPDKNSWTNFPTVEFTTTSTTPTKCWKPSCTTGYQCEATMPGLSWITSSGPWATLRSLASTASTCPTLTDRELPSSPHTSSPGWWRRTGLWRIKTSADPHLFPHRLAVQ